MQQGADWTGRIIFSYYQCVAVFLGSVTLLMSVTHLSMGWIRGEQTHGNQILKQTPESEECRFMRTSPAVLHGTAPPP